MNVSCHRACTRIQERSGPNSVQVFFLTSLQRVFHTISEPSHLIAGFRNIIAVTVEHISMCPGGFFGTTFNQIGFYSTTALSSARRHEGEPDK